MSWRSWFTEIPILRPNYPGSLKGRINHTRKRPPHQQLRSSRPVSRNLIEDGQDERILARFSLLNRTSLSLSRRGVACVYTSSMILPAATDAIRPYGHQNSSGSSQLCTRGTPDRVLSIFSYLFALDCEQLPHSFGSRTCMHPDCLRVYGYEAV